MVQLIYFFIIILINSLFRQIAQIKLTINVCIKTSFKVRFMQDLGLFRVRFKHVSLYLQGRARTNYTGSRETRFRHGSSYLQVYY